LVKEFNLIVIDATLPIEEQQARMRALVKEKLTGLKRIHNNHV